MEYEEALQALRDLHEYWERWDGVTRGEAIVELRGERVSYRNLAKIAGCSEGLMRHLEIVGGLTGWAKQRICDGEATRPSVDGVRSRRQLERQGY